MRGNAIGKHLGVANEESEIVRGTGLGACLCLFQRNTADIGDLFHGNEIDIGIFFCHAAGKIALSAADLQMNGTAGGEMRIKTLGKGIGGGTQQFGAGGDPLGAVLFLSHSHEKLLRMISE